MKLCWALSLALVVALVGAPRPALAWELFRSENKHVNQGNAHLAKGQIPEAIKAYEEAAKELPGAPGVHLDHGLALLKADKLPEAREALRIASQAATDPALRAKAQYNLGLTFLKEADQLSKQEDLEGAHKLLQESADAFKSALRAQPGNRDAAWNMELAKRRLVELDKKQQEKKQQEEEQKKQDEQQDQDKDQDKDKQQQDPDAPRDDQNGQDGGAPQSDDQQKDSEPPKGEDEKSDAGAPPEPQAGPPDAGGPGEPQESEPQPQKAQPDLPEHMQKALDALEDSEENLQKHRAAMRARQRPRRVEKDW